MSVSRIQRTALRSSSLAMGAASKYFPGNHVCNSSPTNALLLLLRLLSRGIPPNSRPISVDRQYDTLQQPPMSNTQRYFVQGGIKGELVQSIVRDNPNPECARSRPPSLLPATHSNRRFRSARKNQASEKRICVQQRSSADMVTTCQELCWTLVDHTPLHTRPSDRIKPGGV